ncbi:MAG: MBOAT family protein [Acidobacteria bacterium]|nr:MBOAT family protein [Acidobacteriota bacterium]
MVFNSFAFFVFFPTVTVLYFALPHRWRWSLLLAASCAFYMFFIPKYILILGFTIVVDYIAGIVIERAQGARRKLFLLYSIAANVGVLGFFKYFNFLNDNTAALARLIGWNYSIHGLSLILPIGLSFHTFQAMSYTIEVYRERQRAERHFGIYALYVMFYPQLVAGPIERPQHLLHQFYEAHVFDYGRVASGLKLMAWGLFKKAVVADRLAWVVNLVYGEPSRFSGPVLAVATVFFAFQIFYDFSGYSDIAIGSARVMGFTLWRNFDSPYQSESTAEFWRRWHMSLSSWFKDYVFRPTREALSRRLDGRHLIGLEPDHVIYAVAVAVTFLLSGLWHGASWTFVFWGALNGAYLILSAPTKSVRERIRAMMGMNERPVADRTLKTGTTFVLITFSWIFFRARSFYDAAIICRGLTSGWGAILTPAGFVETFRGIGLTIASIGLAGVVLVEAVQVLQRRVNVQAFVNAQPWWMRWSLYYAGMASLYFLYTNEGQFIYFQF